MTTETIDDILREMQAKAATLCRKGHLGAAEEWRNVSNRIAKARAAELERFRSVLYGAMEETDYRPVGTWREKRDKLLDLIDKAQEQANG